MYGAFVCVDRQMAVTTSVSVIKVSQEGPGCPKEHALMDA